MRGWEIDAGRLGFVHARRSTRRFRIFTPGSITTVTAPPTGPQSTLNVELGDRRYPIVITSGGSESAVSGLASQFSECLGRVSHAVLIVDAAVAGSVGAVISAVIGPQVDRVDVIKVPSGETSKSVDQLSHLWAELLDIATDRHSVVVAIGGGVIGDLAGFVAATFMRGLRFVQVPTTLLAMVDSSVGGKTGINLPSGKNMVGAFWQPHLVWIDTDFLASLPDRETVSGLAEVIKYGVIEDADFFCYLEQNIDAIVRRESEPTRHAISISCQCKARVVADDERETSGRRAILNYGHTFAHAIESTAGYGVMLHGEAVAIGMQMAARLAIDLGLCGPELLERQTRLLAAARLPIVWADADPEAMIPIMAKDKKVAHGQLRFVLPEMIGHVGLVGDVPVDRVVAAIQATRK